MKKDTIFIVGRIQVKEDGKVMMVGRGAHGWCKKIEEGEGSFLVFLWKMKTG